MKLVFAFLCLAAAVAAELSVLSALGAQDGGLGVQETELGVRTGREANNAAAPAKVNNKPAASQSENSKSKSKKVKNASKGNGKKSLGKKKSTGKKKSADKKKSEKSAGKKSKKASKKSAGKNKSKKSGRKSGGKNKSKKDGKKTKKNQQKKIKKTDKKTSGKKVTKPYVKSAGKVKQTTTCGVADVVAAIKKFTLYTTNLNQNKRIKSFLGQSQSKAGKAPTAFQTALSTMDDATSGGTSCNGGAPNSTVTTIYNKLKNCSASAAALCNVQLSAADNATVNACATSLAAFVVSFQACVANGSCTCFQALPNLTSCTNHSTILAPVASQKALCLGSSTSGSFADCRQQQMSAIVHTTGCKCPQPMTNATMTTQVSALTTRAAGRLARNRDLFRFKKLNL